MFAVTSSSSRIRSKSTRIPGIAQYPGAWIITSISQFRIGVQFGFNSIVFNAIIECHNDTAITLSIFIQLCRSMSGSPLRKRSHFSCAMSVYVLCEQKAIILIYKNDRSHAAATAGGTFPPNRWLVQPIKSMDIFIGINLSPDLCTFDFAELLRHTHTHVMVDGVAINASTINNCQTLTII